MRFVILLFLNLITIGHASLQCFNVHPSHAISNSDPIAELFHVTAGECLNYCVAQAAFRGDGCVSVVFHKHFETCQLYGHDGTYGGSAVVYLEDHEFYIRSSWEGPCRDTIAPRNGYKQKPTQGFVQAPLLSSITPLPNVPQFANADFPQESPTRIRDSVRKAPVNFENELIKEIEKQQSEEDHLYNEYSTGTSTPQKNRTSSIVTTFKNPTHNYKCQKSDVLSYFVVYGSRLSSKQMPQRLNGVDQSSCLMYCSQNINAIGENIPCYSLNYEPTNEVCEMYNLQSREQNSWATVEIDDEHVFADKFCMKTKKDCPTETLYSVHMQKQLTKNIISHIPGMNSKVECLAECIDTKDCKAVTYKIGMCILHSASPSTDLSLMSKGTEKTMVIENGCHVSSTGNSENVPSVDVSDALSSSWQEWSLCQYGMKGRKMRVRQRECDDCDEDMQIEEC